MQGTQIILLIYRLVDHAHKSILNILHLQPFTFDPNSDIIILLEMIIRLSAKTKYLYDSQNITLEAIMKHPFKNF